MKIGLVYTSTTPELIELIESEIRKKLGNNVEMLSYQDPSILEETRTHGYVTSKAAARLVTMYMEAVNAGVDAIINLCSSVGEVADTVQDIAKYVGVPIVRVDEDMCREAVRQGKRIAVMATLSTTLEPTKNTIKRVAREMGKQVELVDVLIDGAFGLNQEEFKARMLKKAGEVEKDVDVILFAQGSMAYCEGIIAEAYGKFVVSSPKFGAAALKNVLTIKGLIQ